MSIGVVYRADATNVGDWYCSPARYFTLRYPEQADIMALDLDRLAPDVLVGGGGLLAKTFHPFLRALAERRPKLRSLAAWGLGESENVDRSGGSAPPYAGPDPDYLSAFDLIGVRDYGTPHVWAPCASCMHPSLDRPYEITRELCIYEHKRIRIPIEGLPRRSNDGNDIDATLAWLGSTQVVITNSYHGAYWATLLGRRVVAIANMSKLYRLKHPPVICRAGDWKRYVDLAAPYPDALAECRAATAAFHDRVTRLQAAE